MASSKSRSGTQYTDAERRERGDLFVRTRFAGADAAALRQILPPGTTADRETAVACGVVRALVREKAEKVGRQKKRQATTK